MPNSWTRTPARRATTKWPSSWTQHERDEDDEQEDDVDEAVDASPVHARRGTRVGRVAGPGADLGVEGLELVEPRLAAPSPKRSTAAAASARDAREAERALEEALDGDVVGAR